MNETLFAVLHFIFWTFIFWFLHENILNFLSTTYDAPSLEYEKFHRPTGKDPVYDRKIKFPFRDFPTDYPPNVERPYESDQFVYRDYYEEGYAGPALSREARKILKAYEERVSALLYLYC